MSLLKALRYLFAMYSCDKRFHKERDLYKIVLRPYLTVSLTFLTKYDNCGCYAYFNETKKAIS